jgi:hypothetical protein
VVCSSDSRRWRHWNSEYPRAHGRTLTNTHSARSRAHSICSFMGPLCVSSARGSRRRLGGGIAMKMLGAWLWDLCTCSPAMANWLIHSRWRMDYL